jgi:magnesium transporter
MIMAVKDEPQVFLFFSEILRREIVDSEGRTVGKILDLTGNIAESYPLVLEVLLRLERDKRKALLPWRRVAEINGTFVVQKPRPEDFREPAARSGALFLKDALMDKQVVDTDGAKIRRVNDLQFLKTNVDLYSSITPCPINSSPGSSSSRFPRPICSG